MQKLMVAGKKMAEKVRKTTGESNINQCLWSTGTIYDC